MKKSKKFKYRIYLKIIYKNSTCFNYKSLQAEERKIGLKKIGNIQQKIGNSAKFYKQKTRRN